MFYIGEEKWAYADSISKNVVVTVDDRFVTYRRLQYFKNEIYSPYLRALFLIKSSSSAVT